MAVELLNKKATPSLICIILGTTRANKHKLIAENNSGAHVWQKYLRGHHNLFGPSPAVLVGEVPLLNLERPGETVP